MKKISITMVCMLLTMLAFSQLVSKVNSFPGTFNSKFTTEELDTITHLKITGILNDVDAQFINNQLKALEFLDIANVTFRISGVEGNVVPENFIDNNSHINSVILPSTAKTIQNYAFMYCSKLQRVILPTELEDIGQGAFYRCSSLDSLELPSTLKTMGRTAFYGCDSLKSVNIPNSVTSVGEWCFGWCSSLETIILPEALEIIPNYAIYHCINLKNVTLPLALTEIGYSAFGWAQSLDSINLPETLVEIDTSAFSYCSSLKSIELPNKISAIRAGTFAGCTNLLSITIPENVTSIEGVVFNNCTSLDTIFVPSSVKNIDDGAFAGYDGYVKFESDNQVLSYEGDLILNKEKTKLIKCPAEKTDTCVIPATVESIGDYAFIGCDTLSLIIFPSSVKEISIEGISYCSAEFEVDVENPLFSSFDGVLFNKDKSTLVKCPTNKEGTLEIPESVEKIGKNALTGCLKLETVEIPKKTSMMDATSFTNCSAGFSVDPENQTYSSKDFVLYNKEQSILIKAPQFITELNSIPETVKSIESEAFRNSKIASVIIPEGVNSIGTYAFYYCTMLTKVVLPSSIQNLGEFSFAYLQNLDTLVCYNKNPIQNMSYYVFYGSNQANCHLMVPYGSKNVYSNNYPWYSFRNIEELPGAKVASSSLFIKAAEGSIKKLYVYSNSNWELNLESDWLTLDLPQGENDQTVTFTATENPEKKNRTTYAYLKVQGNKDIKVTITQYANDKLAVTNIEKLDISVYPNPAIEYFTISGINEPVQIRVFDSSGKKIIQTNLQSNDPVSIQHLKNGLYIVKVNGDTLDKEFRLLKK